MFSPALIPVLATAVAAITGSRTPPGRVWSRTATVALGAWLVAIAVFVGAVYDSGVGVRHLLLGALLALVYVATLVPLYWYYLAALLITGGLVSCPPGSYECPV